MSFYFVTGHDAKAYYCSNSDSITYGLSASGVGCSSISNEGSIAISSSESAITASDFTISSGVVNAGSITVNYGSAVRLIDGGLVENGIRNTGTITSLYSDGIEINGDSGAGSASHIFVNSPTTSYYKGIALYNSGVISASTMNSDLYSDNPSGIRIENDVTINGDIVNSISGSISGYFNGIYINGSVVEGSIVNQGALNYNVGGVYVDHNSYLESIENYGTFTGGAYGNRGIILESDSSIGSIINSGTIYSSGGYAIYSAGSIGSIINNSGSSMLGTAGIVLVGGSVYSIQNYGSITLAGAGCGCSSVINVSAGVHVNSIYNSGVMSGKNYNVTNYDRIENFTNYGLITTDLGHYDIFNHQDLGSIGTLNNLQGAGSSAGDLTICCKLPENYNIIISDLSTYGRLSASGVDASGVSGVTNFGIYSASNIAKGTYSSVLSGVSTANLNNTSGGYNGFKWALKETDITSGVWDLVITGATTSDTQDSLKLTLASLENTYALQSSIINNGLNYDCWVFSKNGVCVQVGGRYTRSLPNPNSSAAAVLVSSYRLGVKARIGFWVDQTLFSSNAASGNSAAIDNSNVNIKMGNSPLFGLFTVWNQKKSKKGLEIKLNIAYGSNDLSIKRQIVGTSEAGTGKTSLSNKAASILFSYNIAEDPILVATPYVGARYSEVGINGYAERYSDDVTAPLTYKNMATKATTILFGVKLLDHINLNRNLVVNAGVGGERDVMNSSDKYNASGIDGLTAIAFNSEPRLTRLVANAGSYYKINNRQRIGLDVFYRQEAFAKISTISGILSYTIGF